MVWFWLFDFGQIQPFMFVVVKIFRSSSNVHVRRCDFFGQVHIFRSYSFGHIDSVKRLFLLLSKRVENLIWIKNKYVYCIWCRRNLSVCRKIWPQLSLDWRNRQKSLAARAIFVNLFSPFLTTKGIFWLNSYLDSHHSQGVWNLQHKFYLYLIVYPHIARTCTGTTYTIIITTLNLVKLTILFGLFQT